MVFFKLGLCVSFFLLVCFIYGATTKQPLCFQLPSVFNSKPIKVILFHINTAAHSDKKSHFNGDNRLRKANENQSFLLLLPMKGKFSLGISSKGKLLRELLSKSSLWHRARVDKK